MGNQEDVENRIAAALFTGCLAERNGRLLVSQRTTPGKLYVGISSAARHRSRLEFLDSPLPAI